jgi:hypothetical protein
MKIKITRGHRALPHHGRYDLSAIHLPECGQHRSGVLLHAGAGG